MSHYTNNIKDPRILEFYKQLQKADISDREIDQNGDKIIVDTDVTEYAAKNSDGKKYDDFLTLISGRKVPWALDDFDDSTDFDKLARERIDTFIDVVKAKLDEQGLNPDTDDYKNSLVWALYVFAQMPDAEGIKDYAEIDRPRFSSLEDGIMSMGLACAMDHIKKFGGLGLADFKDDSPEEASALTSLETKLGLCTERTKILFAVFKRAGLDPVVGHMTARDTYKAALSFMEEFGAGARPPLTEEDYRIGHVFVGLKLYDKFTYFEPNAPLPSTSYDKSAKNISLIELYQLEISNRVGELLEAKDVDAAKQLIGGGLALGETGRSAWIYYNQFALEEGSTDPATREKSWLLLDKAISLQPENASFKQTKCAKMARERKFEEADLCFSELPDDYLQTIQQRAWIAGEMKAYNKQRLFLNKILEMGYAEKEKIYGSIADSYKKEGNVAEQEKYLRLIIEKKPSNLPARMAVAKILKDRGDLVGALEIMRPTSATNFAEPEPLLQIAELEFANGDTRRATQYFKRHLVACLLIAGPITYPLYQRWMAMAEKTGCINDVYDTAGVIGANGNITLPGTLAFTRAVTLIKDKKKDLKELYQVLLNNGGINLSTFKMPSKQEKLENGLLIVPIPQEIYWEFLPIVKAVGDWKPFFKMCHSSKVPSYKIYAIHAALQSKDKKLLGLALEKYDSELGLKEEDASLFDVETIKAIGKAILEVDDQTKLNNDIKRRFKSFFGVATKVFELNSRPEDIDWAKNSMEKF